jgi:hypothetical protein
VDQLESQQPSDAALDQYYQHVNQNLAQAFSALPKLAAYINWRNQQGSYTNEVYEAWSISYDYSVAAAQSGLE